MNGEWPGVLDPAVLSPGYIDAVNRVSDAAKAGDWTAVFEMIDTGVGLNVNQSRIGGRSWFSPLHQAAWLGAPLHVVERLVELGAWRSLRSADGDRPVDVAEARGHRHLLDALTVPHPTVHEQRRFDAWDQHLDELISRRTERLDPVDIRPVQTAIIAVEGLELMSFRYPGMYGGFTMSIHRDRLFVESWSRVVGGSGQAHVITEGGSVLVEEGFV